MKLSIETYRKINKLIPKLLNENKIYSKQIKQKLKISSIFNEFEKKAKNEFNYFIKDSNNRYTNAKNGQDIEHYIEDSQPKYEERLSKIMNDKFYTELNLHQEKEKMKHKNTKVVSTNIKGLLSNIKDNIDPNKLRKNLFNNNNNLNIQNSQKIKNRKFKYNKCYTENELLLNKKTIDDKLLFENKNKKTINNIFSLDQIQISNSIEKYKLNLSKLKIPIIQNVDEENPENKKLNINLPRIKLLYYNISKPKINMKGDNYGEINIHKFLPFSKFGRHLPKQKSENRIIKSTDIPSFMTETINKKWNYESTNNMVINSAKKNLRLRNNYSFKKSQIENLMENNLPSLNDYENILKDKLEKIRDRRQNKNEEINKKQKLNFLSRRQLINLQIDKNIELLRKKEQKFD